MHFNRKYCADSFSGKENFIDLHRKELYETCYNIDQEGDADSVVVNSALKEFELFDSVPIIILVLLTVQRQSFTNTFFF